MGDCWDICRRGDLAALHDFLDDHRAEVDVRNSSNQTCLHLASTYGHLDCVRELLEAGADVELVDQESQWTPLHRAMYHGNLRALRALCTPPSASSKNENHDAIQVVAARLATVDADGLSPLELNAQRLKRPESASVQTTTQLIDLLPSSKADLSLIDDGFASSSTNRWLELRRSRTDCREAHFLTYSFGSATSFQLGYTSGKRFVAKPKVIEKLRDVSSAAATAGHRVSGLIDSRGALYTWGTGTDGALGHGRCSSEILPRQVSALHMSSSRKKNVLGSPRNSAMSKKPLPLIADVCFATSHTILLTRDGEVFLWKRVPVGDRDDFTHCHSALQAQRIQFPSTAGSVVAFSASGQPCRSVFLTSKAEVYTLGARVCDPSVIDEEPRKLDLSSLFEDSSRAQVAGARGHLPRRLQCIVDVAMSSDGLLVLTSCGRVFQQTCGVRVFKRVRFEKYEFVYKGAPALLHRRSSSSICKLEAADGISVALSRDGDTFAWAPLGYSRSTRVSRVRGLPDVKVIDISCSDSHIGAVTAEGDAYVWSTKSVIGSMSAPSPSSGAPSRTPKFLPASPHFSPHFSPLSSPAPPVSSAPTPGDKRNSLRRHRGSTDLYSAMAPTRVVGVPQAISIHCGHDHTIVRTALRTPRLPPKLQKSIHCPSLLEMCIDTLLRQITTKNCFATLQFSCRIRSHLLTTFAAQFIAFNLEHFLPEILHIEDGRAQRSLSDDELAVVEYVFKREFSVPETHAVASSPFVADTIESRIEEYYRSLRNTQAGLPARIRALKKKLQKIETLERRCMEEDLELDESQLEKIQRKLAWQQELAHLQHCLEISGESSPARGHEEFKELEAEKSTAKDGQSGDQSDQRPRRKKTSAQASRENGSHPSRVSSKSIKRDASKADETLASRSSSTGYLETSASPHPSCDVDTAPVTPSPQQATGMSPWNASAKRPGADFREILLAQRSEATKQPAPFLAPVQLPPPIIHSVKRASLPRSWRTLTDTPEQRAATLTHRPRKEDTSIMRSTSKAPSLAQIQAEEEKLQKIALRKKLLKERQQNHQASPILSNRASSSAKSGWGSMPSPKQSVNDQKTTSTSLRQIQEQQLVEPAVQALPSAWNRAPSAKTPHQNNKSASKSLNVERSQPPNMQSHPRRNTSVVGDGEITELASDFASTWSSNSRVDSSRKSQSTSINQVNLGRGIANRPEKPLHVSDNGTSTSSDSQRPEGRKLKDNDVPEYDNGSYDLRPKSTKAPILDRRRKRNLKERSMRPRNRGNRGDAISAKNTPSSSQGTPSRKAHAQQHIQSSTGSGSPHGERDTASQIHSRGNDTRSTKHAVKKKHGTPKAKKVWVRKSASTSSKVNSSEIHDSSVLNE